MKESWLQPTNCLKGWKCPKCGNVESFYIDVTIRARVLMTDDGTLEEDQLETMWEPENDVECGECGYQATVADFTKVQETVEERRGVTIRFINPGTDDLTEVLGPYDYIQATYDLLRVGTEEDPDNPKDLAWWDDGVNGWILRDIPGRIFTDFVIS